MKHIFLRVFGLLLFQMGFSQVYVIESKLPPVLKADAGLDKSIALGDSVQLGGTQSGIDGYGNYVYLWSPSLGLSNPTSANPWAKPGGKSVYTLTVTDFNHCVVMDEVQVNVSGTGIPEEEMQVTIQIYPNPANGLVTLEVNGFTGIGSLTVSNMVGQKVFVKKLQFMNSTNVDLDVSRWEKGLYQVVLQTDKNLFTRSIMVY
jgi:hypothetical protein